MEDVTTTEEQWLEELRKVLSMGGCDFTRVRSIAQNRPLSSDIRAKAWQALLGVFNKPDPFASWDFLYDLREQSEIRRECHSIVEKLGNDEALDKLAIQSDVESVLTLYCKTRDVHFDDTQSSGWSDILQLLLTLRMSRAQLYSTFFAFTTKYIPRGCVKDGRPFDLFRLLLLYHDPQLCSFLDTRKMTPDMFANNWFRTLFAHDCALELCVRLWDVYLQQADPFLIFFMALVMLVNARENFLGNENISCEPSQKIAETISRLPCALASEDISDFCQLAAFYSSRTPQSFRRDYHGPLFGSNLAEEFESVTVHSLLCLPVSVQELLGANQRLGVVAQSDGASDETVRYFVVDTRPPAEYANGHLPGAFNLDASMIVDAPSDFSLAVASLLAFKSKAHPTEHICFMGAGRRTDGADDPDRFQHMLVSLFLQRGVQYLSVARGGYALLHEVLRESLSTRLKSHSVKSCVECRRLPLPRRADGAAMSPPSSPLEEVASPLGSVVEKSYSLFSKVSSVMKSKGVELKEKLVDYVVNAEPDAAYRASPDGASPTRRRQLAAGKPYRDMKPVFSIDSDNSSADERHSSDDDENESDDGEERRETRQSGVPRQRERIKILAYVRRPEVIEHFPCFHVSDRTDMHPGHLVVTRKHIVIVRELPDDATWGQVWRRRKLDSVVKITSKKKVPELLTLRYAVAAGAEGAEPRTRVDRVYVQDKAGDAAKCIKTAIFGLTATAERKASVSEQEPPPETSEPVP